MVNFHSVKLLRPLLSPEKPVCREEKESVSLEKANNTSECAKIRVNPERHSRCSHTVAPEV